MGFFDTAEEKAEKRRKKAQEYLYSAVNRAHTDSTNLNYLQKAVSYGADVLAPMENGKTPFMNMFDFEDVGKGCFDGTEQAAEELFTKHGAVFVGTQKQLLQTIKDCSSLSFALKLCDLLDKEEIKRDLDQDFFRLLYKYIERGKGAEVQEVIDKLFLCHIPVAMQNPDNGWTLLHLAAHEENGRVVKFLLDNGADPQSRDNGLKTPDKVVRWSDEIKDFIRYYKREDAPAVKEEKVETVLEETQVEETCVMQAAEPAVSTDNGEWCLSMADEVAHVTERNKLGYRITQLFNFSARTFTQISTNLKTGGESQTMRTFDEFEDTSIIEQAIAEARKLKMDVSDSVLVKPMGKKDRLTAVS